MRLFSILLIVSSLAFSYTRWGLHEGFTRLVFELPKGASYNISSGNGKISIKMSGQVLQRESKKLDTPQIASFSVSPEGKGSSVSVLINPGTTVKDWITGTGASRKLVVDVFGKGKAGSSAVSTVQIRSAVKKIVVLDPGHGGVDSGAVKYVVEKEVALDLGLRVRKILQDNGVLVVMTRSTDTELSRDKSRDLAMRAAMANSKRNLFVSLHVNSAERSAQGIEVYFFGQNIDRSLLTQVIRENGGGDLGRRLTKESESVASKFIGDLIAQTNIKFSEKLAFSVKNNLIGSTGAVDRGVRSAPFYVIRNASIPAILVESGFANHEIEGKKLATEVYRDTLAKAISRGILGFLDN